MVRHIVSYLLLITTTNQPKYYSASSGKKKLQNCGASAVFVLREPTLTEPVPVSMSMDTERSNAVTTGRDITEPASFMLQAPSIVRRVRTEILQTRTPETVGTYSFSSTLGEARRLDPVWLSRPSEVLSMRHQLDGTSPSAIGHQKIVTQSPKIPVVRPEAGSSHLQLEHHLFRKGLRCPSGPASLI